MPADSSDTAVSSPFLHLSPLLIAFLGTVLLLWLCLFLCPHIQSPQFVILWTLFGHLLTDEIYPLPDCLNSLELVPIFKLVSVCIHCKGKVQNDKNYSEFDTFKQICILFTTTASTNFKKKKKVHRYVKHSSVYRQCSVHTWIMELLRVILQPQGILAILTSLEQTTAASH